jgi:hypothetical protein
MILEMMGLLLMRAAHLTEDKRPTFFKCWAKEGPGRCGRWSAMDQVGPSRFGGCRGWI